MRDGIRLWMAAGRGIPVWGTCSSPLIRGDGCLTATETGPWFLATAGCGSRVTGIAGQPFRGIPVQRRLVFTLRLHPPGRSILSLSEKEGPCFRRLSLQVLLSPEDRLG